MKIHSVVEFAEQLNEKMDILIPEQKRVAKLIEFYVFSLSNHFNSYIFKDLPFELLDLFNNHFLLFVPDLFILDFFVPRNRKIVIVRFDLVRRHVEAFSFSIGGFFFPSFPEPLDNIRNVALSVGAYVS